MLRWNAGELERTDRGLLPPVAFRHLASTARPQEFGDSEGSEPCNRGIAAYEPPDGGSIEMVVVIVGENNGVDRWQIVEVDSGRHHAARTGETERRCPVTPDRIEQKIVSPDLDEKSRVSDPGDRERPRLCPREHESGASQRKGVWLRSALL